LVSEHRPGVSRTIGGHIRGHVVGYVALFVAMTGSSVAAFDPVGPDGDVDLCFAKKTGEVRVMKGAKCPKGERPLAVSQIGPEGSPGQDGQHGPPGETGASPDTSSFLEATDTAGGDISGTFSSLQIANDAVGSAEIANSLGTQVISHEIDPNEAGPQFVNLTDGSTSASTTAVDEFMMPGPGLVARVAVEIDNAASPNPGDGWGVVATRNMTNVGGCFVSGSNTHCSANVNATVSENDELFVTLQPFGTVNATSTMRISVLLRTFSG
jgi:hypothetical protein